MDHSIFSFTFVFSNICRFDDYHLQRPSLLDPDLFSLVDILITKAKGYPR